MLQSMTGFGKGEILTDDLRVTAEIKSVNNRFKDFRFRIPSTLNEYETVFKGEVTKEFNRGSFEIGINYKRISVDNNSFKIDENKINTFVETLSNFQILKNCQVEYRAIDFLRGEFQLETDVDNFSQVLFPLALDAFKLALENLKSQRLDEGKKIKEVLHGYIKGYCDEFDQIALLKNTYREGIESKLLEKVDQFKNKVELDNNRLLQEVIFYMEKLDINEEIDRINFHLSSLDQLLNSNDIEVGRKIDFLLQELNRETNTIGSKSGSKEITNHVVNMKSYLEKIREQGLNLQ